MNKKDLICQQIGLIEEEMNYRNFWSRHIDEYCTIFLTKKGGEYFVTERIHDLISDDKVIFTSIHFIEAISYIASYISGEASIND